MPEETIITDTNEQPVESVDDSSPILKTDIFEPEATAQSEVITESVMVSNITTSATTTVSTTQTEVVTTTTNTEPQTEALTAQTEISEETISATQAYVQGEQGTTMSFYPMTSAESITEAVEGQEIIVTEITFIEEETTQETTALSEEVTEAVIEEPSTGFDMDKIIPYAKLGGMILVVVLFIALTMKMSSQSKERAEKSKGSAKKRDTERINQEKREKNKKKKNNKSVKTKRSVPNTVKSTIPYKKCLENDIWLIADKTYSKAYTVEDINFNLGDADQQENTVDSYCQFLNTLDETVVCQMSVRNYTIDVEEHQKHILIPEANDGYNEYRREYNEKVLLNNLSKGNNAIRKQIIVTMTIECPDYETAVRKFNSIDLTIKNSFDYISGSTKLRPLTNAERTEILKDFFIDSEYKMPEMTQADYNKDNEKTYLAPDYFEFKKDYFLFGDWYAKCVFIKEYPNNAADCLINDLMKDDLEMIVTTTMLAYDSAKARKLVERQIGAITGDMGAREAKAAKSGFFSQQMPVKIKNQLESFKELHEMITLDDEKLFISNTLIMVKAKSYDELQTNMELVNSTLKRNGFAYSEMMWQQEDGMCDCLPVGSKRRFQWNRSLPTESIGILIPFNVKEVRQYGSIYYGLNKLSNNMITFNRTKSLINPAGYILGAPGGGKSFSAKREMSEAYMRYPEAVIIIIDPEREYPAITQMFNGQSIRISTSSKNYINPFDFDPMLLKKDDNDDENYDVIKEKSGLITSFIACMYTDRSLTPQEQSFIDRCVRITYQQSHCLDGIDPNHLDATFDPAKIPILEDFYNVMSVQEENVDPIMKRDMLATLEMYVGDGSANYFNHRTNVDVYNRLVSFDIKDLSGVLKTQAMLLVLDNIWNRLSANRDKHIPTWIYCDEIHVLFSNDYCLDFFQGLYKRARKYGGVLTGITQNVTDLLRNDKCKTMLSNSEYLYLLKQSPSDAVQLKEALNFTESEIFYVSNVGAGEGLMVLGNGGDKIPFYDKFPRDTKMYKAMSTNFSETQAVMQKEKVG